MACFPILLFAIPYLQRVKISSVLDVNIQYNNSQLIHDWNLTSDLLENLTGVLNELIDIRGGYKECDRLTKGDINAFILDLSTN